MLADGVPGEVLLFGPETTPGYEGHESVGMDGTIIHWRGRRLRLAIPGEHNVRNALAAITVGLYFGCSDDEIHAGIEAMQPEFGRGEVLRGRVTVIQDAYNANADSMKEAIRLVEHTPHEGRKVLILGAMYELGSYADAHHDEVVTTAISSGADLVLFYGSEFEKAARSHGVADGPGGSGISHTRGGGTGRAAPSTRAATADGSSPAAYWTDRMEDLGTLVSRMVKEGDLVLLKGSRGTRLERLLPLLVEGRG
jgi:UDP-N-acetylmuramoyl-tripeptide--D-alanyl-D-alanine ligase